MASKFNFKTKTLQKHINADLYAGFSVFLIAVPLSVGIAIASGAPASAGLIAAIIGGVLGSFLGGGHVNINGPAAGLIVIVLSSIQLLGQGNSELGFRFTLAAMVVAGLLQIFFGLLGWAKLGVAFPSSVIHGMLAAIGLIILIKQFFVGIGVTPQSKTLIELIAEIPASLMKMNTEVITVSAITLGSYLGLQKLQKFNITQIKWLRILPPPLIAVLAGAFTAHFFHWHEDPVHSNFLLHIPKNLTSEFITPDFSKILSFDSLRMSITLALVASLESTLSACAADKMDLDKRQTNLNRDLWSKGLCNMICGFIGGLPIITEIVRSSANISSGAQSRYSNFFHGILIFGFVIFFPWLLNEIPLASLAILLIIVGWRLAHPSQFKQAFKIGPDHILAFATTLLVTIAIDLLVGIAAGLLVEFVVALFMGVNVRSLFRPEIKTKSDPHRVVLESHSPVIFSNSLSLRTRMLEFLESSQNLTVDLRKSNFIDHTVMDQLKVIGDCFKDRGVDFKILTSPKHRALSDHELASRRF